jgi:putative ABC transport system permease protein
MRYARLVIANLLRNKRRTVLTTFSVAVAFFLFATLRSVITALDAVAEVGSETRLVVTNASGITFLLPQAHASRIAAVEGVESVTWANWFGGIYIDSRNFFAQFAIDAETYMPMYPEILVPPDQLEAFMAERTAALVGSGLMERFGWQLGQTVTLQGTYLPGDWDFTIRAVYVPDDPSFGDEMFHFHYDYLYERSGRQMSPGWFVLQLEDPTAAAEVSQRIDELFENSTAPTQTETERAFQTSFVTMWGNVGGLVQAIGTAVFFAILFVAANTMMMAARERVGEVAVLKTLGFQNGTLFGMVIAEAVAMCIVGGALGLVVARWMLGSVRTLQSIIPGFAVEWQTILLGTAMAIALGVLTGLIPALQASRLSVIEALRRVS